MTQEQSRRPPLRVQGTYLEEIDLILDGEDVISIVIGEADWLSEEATTGQVELNNLMTRMDGFIKYDGLPESVRKLLDYHFDDDFGLPDCNPITIWTETRIIFTREYDGSTWLHSLPRNPTDFKPRFV